MLDLKRQLVDVKQQLESHPRMSAAEERRLNMLEKTNKDLLEVRTWASGFLKLVKEKKIERERGSGSNGLLFAKNYAYSPLFVNPLCSLSMCSVQPTVL